MINIYISYERGNIVPTYKKNYALRVDEANFEKLKIIADKNRRSINAQIEVLIENCIKEYEESQGSSLAVPSF